MPSPGLFWFSNASGKTCEDLSKYVTASKVKVVHAFFISRSYKWYNFLQVVNSYAVATHPGTILSCVWVFLIAC